MRDTVIRDRFVTLAFPLALAVLIFMGGCLPAHAGQGYEELQNRPLPKTPAERASECAWIRSEQARVRSQADEGASMAEKYNPAMAQSMKAEAGQIQAQLDVRYAQIQCDSVPRAASQPGVPVPTPAPAQPVVPLPAEAPSRASVAAPAPAAVAAPGQATSDPVAAPLCPGGLTFDQCFAKCRELTKRTAEQCFDACRH